MIQHVTNCNGGLYRSFAVGAASPRCKGPCGQDDHSEIWGWESLERPAASWARRVCGRGPLGDSFLCFVFIVFVTNSGPAPLKTPTCATVQNRTVGICSGSSGRNHPRGLWGGCPGEALGRPEGVVGAGVVGQALEGGITREGRGACGFAGCVVAAMWTGFARWSFSGWHPRRGPQGPGPAGFVG